MYVFLYHPVSQSAQVSYTGSTQSTQLSTVQFLVVVPVLPGPAGGGAPVAGGVAVVTGGVAVVAGGSAVVAGGS